MLLKRIITAFVLTAILCTLIYWGFEKNKHQAEKPPEVTGEFNVEILKTGKADAMILSTKNHTVIIDCGETSDAQKVLDTLSEKNINYVDYLFITHFDKDHVGGASEIIDNIDIGNIITPNYQGNSEEYEMYTESCEKKDISPVMLKEKLQFVLDDVLYEIYPPMKDKYDEEDNDFSLAICISHGKNTFLFAGDAEEEREKEFKKQFKLAHTFLKVPHHGRYNDETLDFLKKVSPSYAVITCGKKTPPDSRVTEALTSMGCETFLTSDGSVTIKSDGKNLILAQEKE